MSGLEHFQRECQLDVLVFNSHSHKPLSIHRKGPNPPGPPGLHNSGEDCDDRFQGRACAKTVSIFHFKFQIETFPDPVAGPPFLFFEVI